MTAQKSETKPVKQSPVDTAIVAIMDSMQRRAVRLENLLPPEVPVARFMESIRLALATNPELADPAKTDPASVVLAVMEAARIGLDVHGHYGHLVRYGKECQFIPDYKGLVALAVASGVVRDMQPVLVYERDLFVVDEGENPHVEHKPYIPKKAADSRGEIIAAYTRVLYPDGQRAIKGLLYADDIARVESGAPKGGPWGGKHRPEMVKKTSIKNAKKTLGIPATEQAERLRLAVEADNRAEAMERPSSVTVEAAPNSTTERAKAALKARNTETLGDPENVVPPTGEPVGSELAEIRAREEAST